MLLLICNCQRSIESSYLFISLTYLAALISSYFILQSDLPVREKIFLLLDATQISLGGASGKFPQYHAAYCDLVVSPNVQHVDLATILVSYVLYRYYADTNIKDIRIFF